MDEEKSLGMTPEDRVELELRVLAGELQSAPDFVKLHAAAAYVQLRDQQTLDERRKVIALKKAWQGLIDEGQDLIKDLLAKHGQVTQTGGRKITTAAGTTYLRRQKEAKATIIDDEMAIEFWSQLPDNGDAEDFEKVVELEPKLTPAGREFLASEALKHWKATGQVLSWVKITPAGKETVVIRTNVPTPSTELVARRILPRKHIEYDDDGEE